MNTNKLAVRTIQVLAAVVFIGAVYVYSEGARSEGRVVNHSLAKLVLSVADKVRGSL